MSTTEAIGTTDGTTDERAEFVKGLRDLADFIESTGFEVDHLDAFTLYLYCTDREKLVERARLLGRADKVIEGDWYRVVREFGPHKIQAYTDRALVCERIVVGTETITEEVPDPEALAAVPKVTVEREREIVDWRCTEPLLATERPEVAGDPRGERDR